MNMFVRWMTFNFVGALGLAVQLAVLALLDRLAPDHYLLTSAAAVEVALLHNFLWHTRLTWADRGGEHRLRQLVRFHLSNGLVSLAGNFVLMRLLVQDQHLPVLVSNLIAIACCGLVNFWLGNRWAFAISRTDLLIRWRLYDWTPPAPDRRYSLAAWRTAEL